MTPPLPPLLIGTRVSHDQAWPISDLQVFLNCSLDIFFFLVVCNSGGKAGEASEAEPPVSIGAFLSGMELFSVGWCEKLRHEAERELLRPSQPPALLSPPCLCGAQSSLPPPTLLLLITQSVPNPPNKMPPFPRAEVSGSFPLLEGTRDSVTWVRTGLSTFAGGWGLQKLRALVLIAAGGACWPQL